MTSTFTSTTRAGDPMRMAMRESIRGRRVVVGVASGGRAVTRARAEVRAVWTREARRGEARRGEANGWGDVSIRFRARAGGSARMRAPRRVGISSASGTMTRARRARAVCIYIYRERESKTTRARLTGTRRVYSIRRRRRCSTLSRRRTNRRSSRCEDTWTPVKGPGWSSVRRRRSR